MTRLRYALNHDLTDPSARVTTLGGAVIDGGRLVAWEPAIDLDAFAATLSPLLADLVLAFPRLLAWVCEEHAGSDLVETLCRNGWASSIYVAEVVR